MAVLTTNYEDLLPLIELIKLGKLTSVQEWISSGKPLEPKEQPAKGARKKTPLQYAIDSGFHTMVETLLKGGVPVNVEERCCPMRLALANRRFDLVQLLVEHGYVPSRVDMREVFSTWDPDIMEFLIDRGADPETGMPLAHALIERIRTALRVFKKYKDRFPSFQEQANVALRHHCVDGNLKWVSLMIWAGADPYAPGEFDPDAKVYPDEPGLTAIGFALLYGHEAILNLKQIKIAGEGPALRDLVEYGCRGKALEVLERLLKQGLNPNSGANGGCPTIQRLLERLEHAPGPKIYHWGLGAAGYDSEGSREYMKTIHILAKYGGKWRPVDGREINLARRSLLKMTADHALEFAWIMSKYAAASYEDIAALLNTPTIRRHIAKQRDRLMQILDEWPATAPESTFSEQSND